MQHEDIITSLCKPMAPEITGMEPYFPHSPGIRAVIFDVYGTLFVSEAGELDTNELRAQGHGDMIRAALTAVGLPLSGEIADAELYELYQEKIRTEQEQVRQLGIEHPE